MPKPILQIRVELQEIEPPTWRCLQVPGDYTFWDLHGAIQSDFAWTDTHLHEFRPWGQRDGHPRFDMPLDDYGDNPTLPGRELDRPAIPGHPDAMVHGSERGV